MLMEKDLNELYADKSAEALKYYVRSIALLGEMKRDGSITEEESAHLKSCFMADCHVSSDIAVGRSPNSPRAGLGL